MTPAKLSIALAVIPCILIPFWLAAGQPKPEAQREFHCYVQAAEARMDARKAFVLADADAAFNTPLVKEQRVQTMPANGANPHKLSGAHLYDWMGAVFIPDTSLEKLVRMLQDYGHRANYFPATISTSKLLCRTGKDHFRYSMRMKEPAVLDVDSDVVWARVDEHHWRCRSYATKITEVGKDHGYLRQLYSYWRFAEAEKGVYVEAETITMSDEFGGMTRALGSMLMGINPEKSLKQSLESMRESVRKPGFEVPAVAEGVAECGAPVPRPSGCTTAPAR